MTDIAQGAHLAPSGARPKLEAPAGATAALQLARKGLDVVVLEKATHRS